jgi:hypothetical protein
VRFINSYYNKVKYNNSKAKVFNAIIRFNSKGIYLRGKLNLIKGGGDSF